LRACTQGGSPKDPWIKDQHHQEYLDIVGLSKAIETTDNLPLADLLRRLRNLLRMKDQEERKQVN